MDSTTQVWKDGNFLGRIAITDPDWHAGDYTWRKAALHAARRVFGPGVYHVSYQGLQE